MLADDAQASGGVIVDNSDFRAPGRLAVPHHSHADMVPLFARMCTRSDHRPLTRTHTGRHQRPCGRRPGRRRLQRLVRGPHPGPACLHTLPENVVNPHPTHYKLHRCHHRHHWGTYTVARCEVYDFVRRGLQLRCSRKQVRAAMGSLKALHPPADPDDPTLLPISACHSRGRWRRRRGASSRRPQDFPSQLAGGRFSRRRDLLRLHPAQALRPHHPRRRRRPRPPPPPATPARPRISTSKLSYLGSKPPAPHDHGGGGDDDDDGGTCTARTQCTTSTKAPAVPPSCPTWPPSRWQPWRSPRSTAISGRPACWPPRRSQSSPTARRRRQQQRRRRGGAVIRGGPPGAGRLGGRIHAARLSCSGDGACWQRWRCGLGFRRHARFGIAGQALGRRRRRYQETPSASSAAAGVSATPAPPVRALFRSPMLPPTVTSPAVRPLRVPRRGNRPPQPAHEPDLPRKAPTTRCRPRGCDSPSPPPRRPT